MIFSSYEFIWLFFPITLIIYFLLNKYYFYTTSRVFLVLASLFFYSWWDLKYLPILLMSMGGNYYLGIKIRLSNYKKKYLILGIVANIVLLGYFKYMDFFIENYNFVFNQQIELLNLALPLAISYFTFQQIAFLVDNYKCKVEDYSFLNYSLFISFFPQLIMGPIVHHKEMIPQLQQRSSYILQWDNIALGLFLFSIGLAKKVVLADPLTDYAQNAFDNAQELSMIEAWYASLSYVLSYYFDLSGYADMAFGIALMFNIKLPINFNSPYKARNFVEYWRRWHITLSRFLGEYIYKNVIDKFSSQYAIYYSILITFLVSGIWHGAGWTFVIWGMMNGILVAVVHAMKRCDFSLNFYLAWGLTFLGIILTRILFVSDSIYDAFYVSYTLFDITNLRFHDLTYAEKSYQTFYILIGLFICLFLKNSHEMAIEFKSSYFYMFLTIFLLVISFMNISESQKFLYFQF